MKKNLQNPFRHRPGYNCFGCSPDNPVGLKMKFQQDGEFIISQWNPMDYYQGYGNILHGGIQSTIMDEIASWVVYTQTGTSGMTADLTVRYKNKVYTNKGPILVKAKLTEKNRRIATIETQIFNHKNELCSEGKIRYFLFPQELAKRDLYYPGQEAFFENQEE
ncbi:MAG: PaaI family thioesterase [Bacteroidales bacterium]